MSGVVPIVLDWSQFKDFVATYQLIINYAPTGPGDSYYLYSSNGLIDLESYITALGDVTDFETNFKSSAIAVTSVPNGVGPASNVFVTNFPGNFPATQSGTWNVGITGAANVNAAQSGSWTVQAAQSGVWNVVASGIVAATQSGSWTVSATQSGNWSVSLGNVSGKTQFMVTGSLVTTAVTANQVVISRTVTAGKTFYLQGIDLQGFPTTVPGNNNPVLLGYGAFQDPSGTNDYGHSIIWGNIAQGWHAEFSEPIPFPAGSVMQIAVTPSAATSFTWEGNFWGYEK